MDGHPRTRRRSVLWILAATAALALGPRASGQPTGPVLELPAEDRALLEEYLGKGVIGKAVPGRVITDTLAYIPAKDRAWRYRITSGAPKGQTVEHMIHVVAPEASGAGAKRSTVSLKLAIGRTDVLLFQKDAAGNLVLVSHRELDEGMLGTYTPPTPMLLKGMKPGDVHKTRFEVNVYYLKEPDKVRHSGTLEATLHYVGAYRITVPAGTYEAALIKATFKGKIGPADVDDCQYRFLSGHAGVVALVERKRISAYLLYRDRKNLGKVLLDER